MNQQNKLETSLGYYFRDRELLTLALTHKSFGQPNNERLEFLGDSILNFIIADILFQRFPKASEGELSRVRSALVKGDTLCKVSQSFDIGASLRLGSGEKRNGGQQRASILADALEAVIGALYIDAGMDKCKSRVLDWFDAYVNAVVIDTTGKDPKTRLQEYTQEKKYPLPVYTVLESCGEPHARSFLVECDIGAGYQKSAARASSKRAAEKLAAEKMMRLLDI